MSESTEFNPADYSVIDYLDNQRPRYCGQPVEAWKAEIQYWEDALAAHFPNWRTASPSIHHCGHCGNGMVRYIAAVQHVPTGAMMVFGSECVHKLSFANANELKAAQLRARAELGNARLSRYTDYCNFLSTVPALEIVVKSNEIDKPIHAKNDFARDVLSKLKQYGSLSPRQVETLLASLKRDEERALAPVVVPTAPAPEGRATIEGEVVSTRTQDSDYGTQHKMLVKLDTGAKVWSTIPSSILCEELKGKRIKFTARFMRSDKDQFFAFAMRPTKATIVQDTATV